MEDIVISLSNQDSKTLSQKLLKLMEEVGELSKEILSLENTSGSVYHFTTLSRVVDELVDVDLVCQSMRVHLGISDEVFDSVMQEKINKWARRQAIEEKVTSKIPFEIHITVNADGDLESFKQCCQSLSVKPIILALQREGKSDIKDVMTSSICYGSNQDAFIEMKRIVAGLADAGFTVKREKIETVPWHPAAPQDMELDVKFSPSHYFESHLNFHVNTDQISDLRDLCKSHGVHLSSNVFKQNTDGSCVVMGTIRDAFTIYQAFKQRVDDVVAMFKNKGYSIEKQIVEYALYDSKYSHDNEWLQK